MLIFAPFVPEFVKHNQNIKHF